MAANNNGYDWRERMRRLEDMAERNLKDHERIEGNISGLHFSLMPLKENTDKLVTAIRDLIDRIPRKLAQVIPTSRLRPQTIEIQNRIENQPVAADRLAPVYRIIREQQNVSLA